MNVRYQSVLFSLFVLGIGGGGGEYVRVLNLIRGMERRKEEGSPPLSSCLLPLCTVLRQKKESRLILGRRRRRRGLHSRPSSPFSLRPRPWPSSRCAVAISGIFFSHLSLSLHFDPNAERQREKKKRQRRKNTKQSFLCFFIFFPMWYLLRLFPFILRKFQSPRKGRREGRREQRLASFSLRHNRCRKRNDRGGEEIDVPGSRRRKSRYHHLVAVGGKEGEGKQKKV